MSKNRNENKYMCIGFYVLSRIEDDTGYPALPLNCLIPLTYSFSLNLKLTISVRLNGQQVSEIHLCFPICGLHECTTMPKLSQYPTKNVYISLGSLLVNCFCFAFVFVYGVRVLLCSSVTHYVDQVDLELIETAC